jgi:DNA-binding MarR family transcriptional regulator
MASRLQAELKQHKPFRSLEQEALLSIARTAAVLEHSMAETLKPHRITPTQYNALRILRGAGAPGLCRNEIRDRLIARVPDATRLLGRLEQLELVVRSREGEDRRYVRTHITRAGLALLHHLDAPVLALHRKQLGHLGPARLRALIAQLGQVRQQL